MRLSNWSTLDAGEKDEWRAVSSERKGKKEAVRQSEKYGRCRVNICFKIVKQINKQTINKIRCYYRPPAASIENLIEA